MELSQAQSIADRVVAHITPHCDRIEIAGSSRRRRPEVKDIEVVVISKPYDVGLFQSGLATVVDCWPKVRGELPCKYMQRRLPEGIALDLFFATPENWGAILLIRTGDWRYSKHFMGTLLPRHGYRQQGGFVHRSGEIIAVPEEMDMFDLIGAEYTAPELRSIEP